MDSTRRWMIASAPFAALLAAAGCSMQSASVNLATAKAYTDELVNAAAAAVEVLRAQANVADDVKVAAQTAIDLAQQARAQVDALQASDLASARAAVNTVLTTLSTVAAMPPVIALLGPASSAFLIGLAVIRAFVSSLPLPPDAPAMPPASLHNRAMALRAHR